MKVTVIDYGLSNLLNVKRAFAHLGVEVEITSEPNRVLAAAALVLPGVGAFRDGMAGLAQLGLIEPLQRQAAADVPILGICLGMQMLFDESDEFGRHSGLGLIPGRVEKIPACDTEGNAQRVPNVGWCPLYPAGLPAGGAAGFSGAPETFAGTAFSALQTGEECYFVHSYEAKPTLPQYRLADTVYGGRRICAAAQKGRVLGTQFHPEKSGPVGLSFLEEYLRLYTQR